MSGVRAHIRTRDGGALPHAVLTVTDAAGTEVLHAAADRDGAVRSGEALPEGPYTVTASALGYTSAAATARVTASGRADLGALVLARHGGPELPPPGIWTIDPAHSRVAATAQHLGISSVHGRFTELGGRIEVGEEAEKSGVEAVIAASSIDTGSEMRDRHIRSADFLNVAEHPQITYQGSGVEPAGAPDRWTVHGRLSMHGVVRDVDLDLTCLGTGTGAGPDGEGELRTAFRATAELRRHDFAMNYNPVVAAGIAAIGTTLKIELDIQAVRNDSPLLTD
ncbi:YceI family protein [Streptomyces sp. N2-109]|uniref:YceI family protein n=1 Tax=Streptomyces gossypii TaxID=2883101 RepID=A0ABT2JND2_9ACTN|nr:YceI family protein [Streptomyces gossypii]MCT2589388.1 YceI family protein [Streptomyces gossypii]